MKKYLLMTAVILGAASLPALADGFDLTHKSIQELSEDTSAAASADFLVRYDASADKFVKVGADDLSANFGVTSTAAELNKLDGVTATAAQIEAVASDPGRGTITICGEATTVNNNSVFYGPNITLATTNNGMTCDINAAGSTTEATADAPVLTNVAFQVLGMICRNEGDANADITFSLRSAEAATTGDVNCTITDGNRDCVADVQTTTAIAAGATVAIAATSTGDIADANGFVCEIAIAY